MDHFSLMTNGLSPALEPGPGGGPPLTSANIIGGIDKAFSDVLGRAPTSTDVSYWQKVGNTYVSGSQGVDKFELAIRNDIAKLPEASNDIGGFFQAVLNRPAPASDIATIQDALANGSLTLQGYRVSVADSTEASNVVDGICRQVLNRPAAGGDYGYAQMQFIGGANQAQVRADFADGPEALRAITAIYQQVLDRAPNANEVSYAQGVLSAGYVLQVIRTQISQTSVAAAAINGLVLQVLNRLATASEVTAYEGLLAAGKTQAQVRQQLAGSADAAADIDALYRAVLGRPADSAGLAQQEAALASGQTQSQVRMALAQSAEAAGEVSSLFMSLLGRAPSSDETAGVQAAIGTGYPGDPAFTLSGMVNGAAQTFGTADAATDLTELSVYVTLNSGVTPTLTDMHGHATTFADATQLAGYLLGQAIQSGTATPVLLSTYNLTVGWLAKTGQVELQAGEQELIGARASRAGGDPAGQQAHEVEAQADFDIAAAGWNATLAQASAYAEQAEATLHAGGRYAANYATFYETAARVYMALGLLPSGQAPDVPLAAARGFLGAGFPTNPANTVDKTDIANAEADECLQNEALAPAGRHAITERLVSTQSSSTTIDVTVDQNGYATVHDKDQSASPVLGIVTAVIDLVAAIPGPQQVVTVPVAAALNLGEAANDFAQGQAVLGVIQLGAAAGFGALQPGVDPQLSAKIFAADAVVAGSDAVAQSSRSGSSLGVIAGALEVSAGIAGGLISFNQQLSLGLSPTTLSAIQKVATGLGVAGGLSAGAAAIEKGDVADGLLTTLGPLFSAIASSYANWTAPEGPSIVLSTTEDTGGTQVAGPGGPAPLSADVVVLRNRLFNIAQDVSDNFNFGNYSNLTRATLGSRLHKMFADAVRAQNIPGVLVEQSYFGGDFARYGFDGSVRTDVIYYENGQPVAVFDYKTGAVANNGYISPSRQLSILQGVTGLYNPPNIRVIGINVVVTTD